ncbi:CYTH and CHAD domain-containing protein [Shinella sedimenti]|uniref:CHAD domain-containing protein n=1 Tax=Shinella sedimenti TaxID=2919913 RepID=A0ABT0CSQ4_9HYPH|nr:CHAD domain-containing protein [Shinella sedimenti]MCJ8151633.1 CHAD domain-containing protein [Shinella sedimenti]
MGQDVELKLDLAGEEIVDLVAAGLVSGEPVVLARHVVYYDTPDRALRAAGFSLRIRKDAEGYVQIAKAVGGGIASVFARPKWERNVENDTPVLDDTTPIRAFLGRRADEIQPVFEVATERRRWSVLWEGTRIEMALDRGSIVAGDRKAPIAEIKLKLEDGKPDGLFSFARRLGAVMPLRLGVLSKAERGYGLTASPARAVKADPVALVADMSVSAAFRTIAHACIRQFRMNEDLMEDGGEDAVHQARVALRRLRSAFSVFNLLLEGETGARLADEVKWLAGVLGSVRDLDVLVARCKDDALRARLAEARATAFREAAATLAGPRARALMLDVEEWLVCGSWQTQRRTREIRTQPLADFAAGALDRLRRKVKKGGRDLADVDDEARHAVRKDAKKLRYAAGFFAALFDRKRQKRRYGRFIDALEALQDRLGVLNDTADMPEVLARLGFDEKALTAFTKTEPQSSAGMLAAAAEAHEALIDTKRFWR